MSLLGQQTAGDLATVMDDWGDPLTFTAPTGDPPTTITGRGLINRTSMGKDIMTGETVPAKRASLSLIMSEYPSLPADGWKVDGSDHGGAFTSYVKGDPLPDLALGSVTIMLME